jgi:15-hydroxyprostaglandin dehydrogenase (NAD)
MNVTGVRVIALCPSATESDLIQDVKKQLFYPEYEKAWRHDTANCVPQK